MAHHVQFHTPLEEHGTETVGVVPEDATQGVHQGAGKIRRGVLRCQVAHVEPQGFLDKFAAGPAVVRLQPAIHPLDHVRVEPDSGAFFVLGRIDWNHLPVQK